MSDETISRTPGGRSFLSYAKLRTDGRSGCAARSPGAHWRPHRRWRADEGRTPGRAARDHPDQLRLIPSPARAAIAAAPFDFDGSGYADLASGIPGESVGSVKQAGAVEVIYASARGLTPTGAQLRSRASAGVDGEPTEGEQFGRSLTSADFDRDGYADLAALSWWPSQDPLHPGNKGLPQETQPRRPFEHYLLQPRHREGRVGSQHGHRVDGRLAVARPRKVGHLRVAVPRSYHSQAWLEFTFDSDHDIAVLGGPLK